MSTVIYFKPTPFSEGSELENIVVKDAAALIADEYEDGGPIIQVLSVNGHLGYIPKDSILYWEAR